MVVLSVALTSVVYQTHVTMVSASSAQLLYLVTIVIVTHALKILTVLQQIVTMANARPVLKLLTIHVMDFSAIVIQIVLLKLAQMENVSHVTQLHLEVYNSTVLIRNVHRIVTVPQILV